MRKNINSLIKKYGEPCQIGNMGTFVFIDENRLSVWKSQSGYKEYTGLDMAAILTKEAVGRLDTFKILDKEYLVLERIEIRKNGEIVYSDIIVFNNDFIHKIKIHDNSMQMGGINLPEQEAEPYIEADARIKTVKMGDLKEFALHTDKVPTHIISILMDREAYIADTVDWEGRKFEVLGSEDLNEQGRILTMWCIEVLNG